MHPVEYKIDRRFDDDPSQLSPAERSLWIGDGKLTARQREVLALIARGLSKKQIARVLALAARCSATIAKIAFVSS